jgi:uncharacterized protein YjbI with pentapeptide repeats
MRDSPEKIQALKDRWMLDPAFGLIRPSLVEALRALQDGETRWEEYLEDVPFAQETDNGRDLRGVDFSGIRGMGLRYMRDGFLDLHDVDFYRTHLEHSNLYRVHLEDSNMYSAHMDGANLRNTHLRGAVIEYISLDHAKLHLIDLRGFDLCTVKHLNSVDLSAVRLNDALLNREQFKQADGSYRTFNEVQAREEHARCLRANEPSHTVIQLFTHARDTYLSLKNNFVDSGKYTDASWASVKEKEMEKLLLWHQLRQKTFHGWQAVQKTFELFGYRFFNALFQFGENPWRLLWWAMAIMVLCALIYPLSGITVPVLDSNPIFVSYAGIQNMQAFADTFLHSLYLSVVTFTTVGYGDVLPIGRLSHLTAGCEAIAGLFIYGLFVFTLGRRVSAR